MKTALFTNFSTEEFIGYWDGKKKTFKPGMAVYMPDYLAAHFAKHLVNRELLKNNPPLERCTSPKKPQDVPEYWERFNKAYTPDDEDIDTTEGKDELDVQMEVISRSKGKEETKEDGGLQTPTMEDEDDEDAFPDKPQDGSPEPQNGAPQGTKA